MGLRSWASRLFRWPPGRGGHEAQKLADFQRTLGLRFADRRLLRKALTHRSYLQGNGDNVEQSNERLEFLGDSVLELIVNEHLYHSYTGMREGDLTKMKSLLVSKKVLADCAQGMNLGNYVLLSRAEDEAGGRERTSILADTWEAVLGAIYLDRGLDAARTFVRGHLLSWAEIILADRELTNFKNLLQEFVQAEFKTHPRYRTSSEEGPDHEKVFTVEVMVQGKSFGEGRGTNKKQAEQEAARAALEQLGKLAALEPAASALLAGPRTPDGEGELPGGPEGAPGGRVALGGGGRTPPD